MCVPHLHTHYIITEILPNEHYFQDFYWLIKYHLESTLPVFQKYSGRNKSSEIISMDANH